jgi:dipeptidyl-peptidase-4
MKRGVLVWGLLLIASLCQAQAGKRLTLESIFAEGGITGRAPEAIKWSPDGAKLSFVQRDDSGEHGVLYYIDVAEGKQAVLVAAEKLDSLAPPLGKVQDEREKEWIQRYAVTSYQWSPDSKSLLFNAHGQLWLYTLSNGTAVQLTFSAEPSADPKFSPDSKQISYVRKHNLYALAVEDNTERALTTDKDENLWNGEVDWVYAEELSVRSNYFWSPDGKQVAFLQMNEKQVPSYPITDWVPLNAKVDQQKYPKAGDPNPEVRLGVIGATSLKIKWIPLGKAEEREYIPRFGWVRPGLLYVEQLNRAQNQLELWFTDTGGENARKMLEEDEPKAWVPVDHAPEMWLLSDKDGFLWPSWRDGFMQLYLYRFNREHPLSAEARLERQLTKGDFEVASIDAADEHRVFITANAGDPRQQQIYSAAFDGDLALAPVTREPGTHQAIFSPDGKHYVDNFSARMTPPRVSLCPAGGGECRALWESHPIGPYELQSPERLELKAADGATVLYGTLLMPSGVAPGAKIPLIDNPYGGPGAQSVVDSWGGNGFLFDQMLARDGFAVLHVDNRGMAGRGKAFAVAPMRHFGQVELADQLAALQQVLATHPQLDSQRLGWWGWSYGGYLTLYALTHAEQFKAGVAVAPVTDWREYDSIYTERYMGLPADNEEGYRNSSAVNSAAALKGHLLEAHGTSDDNVHVQNTMQMIDAFINHGVEFDLQLYPRKTHSIAGAAARTNLYRRIEAHFQRWLAEAQPRAQLAIGN